MKHLCGALLVIGCTLGGLAVPVATHAEVDEIVHENYTTTRTTFTPPCQANGVCINGKMQSVAARFIEKIWNRPPESTPEPENDTNTTTSTGTGSGGGYGFSFTGGGGTSTGYSGSGGSYSYGFSGRGGGAGSGSGSGGSSASGRGSRGVSASDAVSGTADVCNFTALNPDCSILPPSFGGPARKVSMGTDINGCKIGSACAYPEETCRPLVGAPPCPSGQHYEGNSVHEHGCELNAPSCRPDKP